MFFMLQNEELTAADFCCFCNNDNKSVLIN